MKKWFLIIAIAIGSSGIYANHPEKIEMLSAKVIMQDNNGYFALVDGSCWKVIGFSKRWKSLSEWWNNVQLVPENYECVPNDWDFGAQIEVYSKYENLEVNEANASNQEDLKQCTHLLVNTRTGQVLFAIALHPAECIVRLFYEAQNEGYKKGYSDGHTAGYYSGYNDGYAQGYHMH